MEIKPTSFMMFGLVVVRYIKPPTNLLYKDAATIGLLYSLLGFVPIAMGVFVGLHFFILNLFKMPMAYLC